MPRVNPRFINSDDKMKYLDLLWTSIAGLQSRDEVKNFFKDLLSEGEAIMLARRIQIAKMLLKGKTYEEVVSELHVGLDTVGKVQRWLTSGLGGYQKAVESFERELKKRVQTKERGGDMPYSFGWLKKKYPMHFLLFNLMDRIDRGGKN